MGKPIRWFGAVACLVLVFATACGSKGNEESAPTSKSATTESATVGSATTAPRAGSAAQIAIAGFAYTQVTVPAGAQVTVVNKDSAEHTVTSDANGLFDTEVPGNGQATFTAPNTPGSYPYHCTYHPGMHGTLVVQ